MLTLTPPTWQSSPTVSDTPGDSVTSLTTDRLPTFSLEPVRRSEKHTSEPSPTSMLAWSQRTLRHDAPFARATPSFGSSGNLARSTALSTLLPLSFSSFFAPAGM